MTEATVTHSTTDTLRSLAPGGVGVEHEFDLLMRERRLARIEHGDLD